MAGIIPRHLLLYLLAGFALHNSPALYILLACKPLS